MQRSSSTSRVDTSISISAPTSPYSGNDSARGEAPQIRVRASSMPEPYVDYLSKDDSDTIRWEISPAGEKVGFHVPSPYPAQL